MKKTSELYRQFNKIDYICFDSQLRKAMSGKLDVYFQRYNTKTYKDMRGKFKKTFKRADLTIDNNSKHADKFYTGNEVPAFVEFSTSYQDNKVLDVTISILDYHTPLQTKSCLLHEMMHMYYHFILKKTGRGPYWAHGKDFRRREIKAIKKLNAATKWGLVPTMKYGTHPVL